MKHLKKIFEKKSLIDLKTLEKLAKGIELVCLGEYGITFVNFNTNSIFVCLGDSNPFDESSLKNFFLECCVNYSDYNKLNIIIENETYPNKNDGWMIFKNDKFRHY